MVTSEPLLRLSGLHVGYRSNGIEVDAVRGVDLEIAPGEVVALVGESGSGKSTTAHSIIGLLPATGSVTAGSITYDGSDITRLRGRALRKIRGAEIGFIPQDPNLALNPVKRVGEQVAEALRVHGLAGRAEAAELAIEILDRAGLSHPAARAKQYPHELSGGMKQRVLIGIALACRPKLVIADEPTSALDVTVQKRVLDHLGQLTAEDNTSVLLITHDLGVAADRADRIVVMRHGKVVESAATAALLATPTEPYTQKLLAAAPSLAGKALIGVRPPPPAETRSLLHLENVTKRFPLPGSKDDVIAVDNVSITVHRGRTYSLIGESGSGKSTLARIAMRLEQASAGRVWFDGADITTTKGGALRELRRRVQLVYQNPYSSLDPRLSIDDVITEPLRAFGIGDRVQRATRAVELLDQVALPAGTAGRKAVELSGGQRQRVAIARALALRPELLVLDEPVSALDVSVQDQILRLLVQLQEELELGYLFISHDFAVVQQISDEIGVLRRGELVEQGPTAQIFGAPVHEYTRELITAVPGTRAPAGGL
ncbi:MAG: ABC transporter ATP-binding protein [Mycobacterium sp.]